MVDTYAEIIWNYLKLSQPLVRCDAILVLGSIDDRVAEYGAKLFLEGYGKWLVISGGKAHADDMLATNWPEPTEAEHFNVVAKKAGVPEDKIILETEATNTGENFRFTHKLLQQKGLDVASVLVLQKPYALRRTFATFKKQWPDKTTHCTVASPPIAYKDYFNELQPKDKIINIMVGDVQRMKEYPKLGYQIHQDIPAETWQAYEKLVELGYNKHLIR